MISEGTDIPRLQVCCHLTRVKTELYFRQVLGRILRAGRNNDPAYLYMPAEPLLIAYAERVSDDIPDSNTVIFTENSEGNGESDTFEIDVSDPIEGHDDSQGESTILFPEPSPDTIDALVAVFGQDIDNYEPPTPAISLAELYDSKLNIFGRFHSRLLRWHSTNTL